MLFDDSTSNSHSDVQNSLEQRFESEFQEELKFSLLTSKFAWTCAVGHILLAFFLLLLLELFGELNSKVHYTYGIKFVAVVSFLICPHYVGFIAIHVMCAYIELHCEFNPEFELHRVIRLMSIVHTEKIISQRQNSSQSDLE